MNIIGYWKGDEEEDLTLPDPSPFVNVDWIGHEELHKLVAYLKHGHFAYGWLGYSSCRFRCGIPNSSMGTKDLYDGEWIWPEGLAHYIESHRVMLPNEFIDHCRTHNWTIPEKPAPLPEGLLRDRQRYMEFWRQWAKTNKKPNKSWMSTAHKLFNFTPRAPH